MEGRLFCQGNFTATLLCRRISVKYVDRKPPAYGIRLRAACIFRELCQAIDAWTVLLSCVFRWDAAGSLLRHFRANDLAQSTSTTERRRSGTVLGRLERLVMRDFHPFTHRRAPTVAEATATNWRPFPRQRLQPHPLSLDFGF